MSRSVTILVLGDDHTDLRQLKRRFQDTAGVPCALRTVAPNGGTGALNKAMAESPEDDIVWTVPQIRIETEGWLRQLQASVKSIPNWGVVGAKIFDPTGLIYSCGRLIVSPFGIHEHLANIGHGESDAAKFKGLTEVDSVLPWLCYLRREAIDAAGGFDELFGAIPSSPGHPAWLENDDFCLSIRSRGFSIHVDSAVRTTHPDATTNTKLEALYQKAATSPLDPIDHRVVNVWRKKWRWHPGNPDLRAVREKWLETPICWRIGPALLDNWKTAEPAIDVIMVTRNNLDLLRGTLDSLMKTKYAPMQLWVHLNGSTDASRDYLEQRKSECPFPIHLSESPVNIGHAPAVNWLLGMGEAPLIAKLDDDIEFAPDGLTRLVTRLRDNPYAGAVGTKVVNVDAPQTIQWADYRIWPHVENHQNEKDDGQFDYLSRTIANMGCCILYRRKAIQAAGPYDISLNPNSWDDLDHQVAIWKAGYEVLYDGQVAVRHPYKPLRDQCRRALGNTLGNGYKVAIKWGPGAMQALDESLDQGGRRLDQPTS
jgi:GT2 family glycosyltransferase